MKTSELEGSALDWAVAKAEGLLAFGYKDNMGLLLITLSTGEAEYFKPTLDWAQGGPIIERHIAKLEDLGDEGWEASGFGFTALGDTPLVAAMRCFVASNLGDEVDVPEELLT